MRTLVLCEESRLDILRSIFADLQAPGLTDVGEGDNFSARNPKVTRDGKTFLVADFRVLPDETGDLLESLLDPKPEQRADWDDRIDAIRLRIQTARADDAAKTPAERRGIRRDAGMLGRSKTWPSFAKPPALAS